MIPTVGMVVWRREISSTQDAMRHGFLPALLLSLLLVLIGSTDLAGQEFTPAPTRPALQNFPKDLARNSLGLFSGDNLYPLLIGTGATAAASAADDSVQDYFVRRNRLGSWETVGEHAGHQPIVFGAVGGLLTVSQFTGDLRFARFSYDLAQAEALTGLMTFGLKHAIGRTRPSGENDLSFPSGHTSTAFTAATVFGYHYGPLASVAGYAAASFVAASRLDASKHYLSDVAAGATIGYIVGRTVTRGQERRSRRLAWMPIVSPGTRTIGLALSWRPGN